MRRLLYYPYFIFVAAFLQGADLEKVTSKVVRQKVGEKLGVDLSDKRKEIDALVMAYVDNQVRLFIYRSYKV